MYTFYKDSLVDRAKVISSSCIIPAAEEALMLDVLDNIKDIHPEYSNITNTLSFNADDIEKLLINRHQKLFITNYNKTSQTIRENREKAAYITKPPITLTVFNFILLEFNRLLWKAMIDKAYIFKHNMIGHIYAYCRPDESCKPKPNWAVTAKNKKELLEKGLKPRYELEARTAEFNEEVYDGIPFVELNKPFNVAMKWRRSTYAKLITPDIKGFNMQLIRSNDGIGIRDYLKTVRDTQKLEDLLIKYQKNNA
jgi:hypothetical protein